MVTLLHGENQAALRNRLADIKQEFAGEVLSIDSKETSPEMLTQSLQPKSLFEVEKKMIVVENLSSQKDLLAALTGAEELPEIVLVEDKQLTKTQISALEKVFSKMTVQEFKIDQVVFKFLDNLQPREQKKFLPLWQAYKSREASEVILVMLTRQFRLLLLAKFPDANEVADWSRLSDWQKQKLEAQAGHFTVDSLKKIFSDLSKLDYDSKTGQLPTSLSDSLELFLLTL